MNIDQRYGGDSHGDAFRRRQQPGERGGSSAARDGEQHSGDYND
ncbi:hypothetical protein [Trinickia symbiotica]|nr:hypothetical protein [Trinickia symbiotica]